MGIKATFTARSMHCNLVNERDNQLGTKSIIRKKLRTNKKGIVNYELATTSVSDLLA